MSAESREGRGGDSGPEAPSPEGAPARPGASAGALKPARRQRGRLRELTRWTERLGRVGLRRSPDEIAAVAAAWTGRLDRARAQALAPFQPYFDITRTDQRWGLFLEAHAYRYRMHVESQDASGAWTLRYRPLDPAARELASQLEYRRMRAAWNPRSQGTREPYKPFVSWVAKTLFEREPGLRAVRVRMERFQIPRPGEAPDPETSWHFEEVRRRPRRGR
jgi:hypothetical protein